MDLITSYLPQRYREQKTELQCSLKNALAATLTDHLCWRCVDMCVCVCDVGRDTDRRIWDACLGLVVTRRRRRLTVSAVDGTRQNTRSSSTMTKLVGSILICPWYTSWRSAALSAESIALRNLPLYYAYLPDNSKDVGNVVYTRDYL